ncbi:MAG: hypothetical protein HY930_03695, partial [Euryarchaeota archaeon]|nr:hypothetical protein [Euryarchaeota archaeon]
DDIEKLQKELEVCTVKAPEPIPALPKPQLKPECAAIDKEAKVLKEKLAAAEKTNASKEDLEKLRKEIEIKIQELKACAGPTPGVKNPCDEVSILKESLEQLLKKRVDLEALINKGEIGKENLEAYEKEVEYIKKRLEQMSFTCQQGKPVEESPCARLGKLEIIHREIGEKEKLEKITEEILALKDKCRKENLKAEKVESLADIEKVYETKLKVSVESAPKEIVTELKKIEEEKNRLVEDFAKNASELELKGITMIKKVRIEGESVFLDDIKVKVPTIKVDVEGKEVEIKPREGEVTITQGNATVKGNVKLEYVNDTLVAAKSGKAINVLPSEVEDIVGGEIKEIKITDEEVPKYIAKSKKEGRFLGIIPLSVTKEYEINAESGKVIVEKKPWWSFMIF